MCTIGTLVFRYEKCDLLKNFFFTHSMDETKLRHLREAIQQEKKQPLLRQNYAMKKDHGGGGSGSNFVKSANNSPNSSVDRKVINC